MARQNLVGFAILFEAGLGIGACLLGWILGCPPWESLRWESSAMVWGVVATMPLFAGLLITHHGKIGPLTRLVHTVEQLVDELFSGASTIALASVCLAAGFGEELLFRGLIQGLASDWFGTTAGLVLASGLFGLAHPWTTTYVLLASLIGIYLGTLWIWFDNLLVPMVAHALYDYLALVYLLRTRKHDVDS